MSEPTNLDQASSPKKTAQHSEVVVGIENKRSASALSMNDAQSIIDQHCSKRTVNVSGTFDFQFYCLWIDLILCIIRKRCIIYFSDTS